MSKLKTRKGKNGYQEIFDFIRKKWVAYTPEEEVRQLFLYFLTEQKGYLAPLIAVEYPFIFENGKKQRADIVVFNSQAQPLMVIECKAAHIEITQEVCRQVTRYNAYIKAPYIAVSNSINTYCLHTDDLIHYHQLMDFPDYKNLYLTQNPKTGKSE